LLIHKENKKKHWVKNKENKKHLLIRKENKTTTTTERPVFSVVDRFIPRVTVTHTKTLWVTKVSQLFDNQVTATLVAQNCLPVDSEIPYCHPE
jgi:replication-associated recombination protein RarA